MAASQIRKINGGDQAAVLKGISQGSEGDIKLIDGGRVSITAKNGEDTSHLTHYSNNNLSYEDKRGIAKRLLGEGTSFVMKHDNNDLVYEFHEV